MTPRTKRGHRTNEGQKLLQDDLNAIPCIINLHIYQNHTVIRRKVYEIHVKCTDLSKGLHYTLYVLFLKQVNCISTSPLFCREHTKEEFAILHFLHITILSVSY